MIEDHLQRSNAGSINHMAATQKQQQETHLDKSVLDTYISAYGGVMATQKKHL